jgi:hypothetical protein
MRVLFLLFFSVFTCFATSVVTLTGAGIPPLSDGTDYVGPYTLSISGVSVPALCVDYPDESYIGDTWTVFVSSINGNLSQTYHPGDAVQYQEAAYLFDLIIQPGSDRIDLQHAVWALLDPTYAATLGPKNGAQTYITQAEQNYSSGNYSNLELLSEDGTSPHGGREQEFLVESPVATPEPGTFLAMGLGLAIAGAVRIYRDRSRGSASKF